MKVPPTPTVSSAFRLALTVAALAISTPAHALNFGSPAGSMEEKTFHVTGGFGVAQRTVLNDDDGTYRSVSGVSFIAKAGYAPWSWIDVSLLGGVASLSRSGADPKRSVRQDEDMLNEFDVGRLKKRTITYTGFLSPTVGAQVRFNLLRKTKAGLDVSLLAGGQAIFGDGQVSEYDAERLRNENVAVESSHGASMTQIEAGSGLVVSRRTDNMVPYIGGYWAYLQHKLDGRETEKDYKRIGMFVGLDYYVTPAVFFSLELHNFDQDAAFGSVGAEF